MTLYVVVDTGATESPLMISVEVIKETRRYYAIAPTTGIGGPRGRILKETVDVSPESVHGDSHCVATSPCRAWALALQRARVQEGTSWLAMKDAKHRRRRLEREAMLRATVGTVNCP